MNPDDALDEPMTEAEFLGIDSTVQNSNSIVRMAAAEEAADMLVYLFESGQISARPVEYRSVADAVDAWRAVL